MKPHGRMVAVLLTLFLLAAGLVPLNALAIKHMTVGGGSTSATEGDPLDANDYSSGSGGGLIGDNIHEVPTAPVTTDSFGVFEFPVGRISLLMAVDFRSGMPVLRIFSFSEVRTRPEARHGR